MKLLSHFSPAQPPKCMFWLFLFASMLIADKIQAQQLSTTPEEKKEALGHLNNLKEGKLIIVLKSGAKQLEAYQKVIDNENASNSQKRRATKQRDQLKETKETFHQALTAAFDTIYTFSNYAFVYDYDLSAYLDGNKNLLRDASLNVMTAPIQSDFVYFAKEGYTNPQDGARVLAYSLYDVEGNLLKHPVPNVKITHLGPILLFRGLFGLSEYRDADEIVEKLNDRLTKRRADL